MRLTLSVWLKVVQKRAVMIQDADRKILRPRKTRYTEQEDCQSEWRQIHLKTIDSQKSYIYSDELWYIRDQFNLMKSYLIFSFVFKCSDVDDILHMAQLLVDFIDFGVKHLGKFLYFNLSIDILTFLFMLFALEMEGAVDGKPIQFSTLILVVNKPLDTCQAAQFALLYVDQELHIIPYNMVLFFVFLKTILLSVQNIPLNSANKTYRVLVLL